MNLGFSHPVVYPIPDGHQDHLRAADGDQGGRRGQAPGRPGGVGDPRLAPARALQGQGRALHRRDHPSQGRQEEVSRQAGPAGASASAPALPVAPEVERAAAAVGVPLGQAYLRAGDRRRAGPHGGRGVVDRQDAARGRAEDRRRQGGRRGGRQAGRRTRGCRRHQAKWCSIAAPICITAASRRWPTPPARAGWRSDVSPSGRPSVMAGSSAILPPVVRWRDSPAMTGGQAAGLRE